MEEQDQGPANDLERRIIEAFEIFDHAQNKNIDVREVGAVIRSLGCCPTEAQLQEVLMEVEDPDTGSVSLDKFLPYMVNVITEYQMQPASAEALLKAFQVMDPERKGFVSKEVLMRNMLELGEPFSQDELDEMLTVAVDPETGTVPYEYYINQIMVSNIFLRHTATLNRTPTKLLLTCN
ncbi:dynein regulatory complex protein 8-like isoform X2 [Frankliniella occidentalis]|uniref:Dynein regulatory complex protein 8-like isoform X2 n=1 Tax=Frankliniella occidentalis TaxID=133901 RepID=A0A9C6U3U0_FRAOC|nr:dynein regulatory complex protein 8-like isoform X2 [Frankliniella occidentalis]